MKRVFIGYDERQRLSYHVLAQSLIEKSSIPLAITALHLPQLPIKRAGLTPFTYSRFLVPYLCGFEGWALFLDADMLVLGDVAKLFECANDEFAVMVRREKQQPFEWASLMLFNCAHPENKILTPKAIDGGMKNLHTISWCKAIGEIPQAWNYCVGYDEKSSDPPSLLHYTQGVPVWPETKDCDLAQFWEQECRDMHTMASWEYLMGRSVHASHVRSRLSRQNG